MKRYKLIPLVLLCFFWNSCKLMCQNSPSAGQYITNNTMGGYEGTWRWTNGNDTVQLHLMVRKVFFNMNGGFYWDCLVGWHLYKRGAVVIESSYQFINDIDKNTFLGGNENRPPTVKGTFDDISKKKHGNLQLNLNTNTSPNQLTWTLKNSEGVKYRKPTDPPYYSGFTLPQNMVLLKQ